MRKYAIVPLLPTETPAFKTKAGRECNGTDPITMSEWAVWAALCANAKWETKDEKGRRVFEVGYVKISRDDLSCFAHCSINTLYKALDKLEKRKYIVRFQHGTARLTEYMIVAPYTKRDKEDEE